MPFYLNHIVFGHTPEKLMQILESGYLYSSSCPECKGNIALAGNEPMDYVYFLLLGDNVPFQGGINFILSDEILFRRSF